MNKNNAIKNFLFCISIFLLSKISYSADFSQFDRASFERNIISSLQEGAAANYENRYQEARKKCEALADNIHFSLAKVAPWIKILLFSMISMESDKATSHNPLIYTEYLNDSLGQLMKEFFKLFKIELEVIDKNSTTKIPTNIPEIPLATTSKIYFQPLMFNANKIYIKTENNLSPELEAYALNELMAIGQSILIKLCPQIDKKTKDIFKNLLLDALQKNATLKPLFSFLEEFAQPINSEDKLDNKGKDLLEDEFLFELIEENANHHSVDLKMHINTKQSELYYSLASKGSQTKLLATTIATSMSIDSIELKTLLYSTLLLGDMNTNPLLNPASFTGELGRLIQCVFRCFGIRLIKSSQRPTSSLVSFQTSFMNSYSLFYDKEKSILSLYSPNPFEAQLENHSTVFLITDIELRDYVVNHFKNLLHNVPSLGNIGPQILKEDVNLAYASEQIWNALLTTKNSESQKLDGYFPNLHEIEGNLFKKIFLDEFENSFAPADLSEQAQNKDRIMALKIQESNLTAQQKAFFYWFMQLNFSQLEGMKKGEDLVNPLASGTHSKSTPLSFVLASFIDIIDAHEDSFLDTIKISKLSSLSELSRKFKTALLSGIGKDIQSSVMTKGGIRCKQYDGVLQFICRILSEKFPNYEVFYTNEKLVLRAKNNLVSLVAYADKKIIFDQRKIKDYETKILEEKREECLKFWINSIDLNRYDEVLKKAREAFIPQEGKDGFIPINTEMGDLLEEIEKIPETKMGRAKKMLLYIIMAEDYEGRGERFNFFKGYWCRIDMDIIIDSTAIVYLLNLDNSLLALIQNKCKNRKKNKQLNSVWKNDKKNTFSNLCKRNFQSFFKPGANQLLQKIGSYFKQPIYDPRPCDTVDKFGKNFTQPKMSRPNDLAKSPLIKKKVLPVQSMSVYNAVEPSFHVNNVEVIANSDKTEVVNVLENEDGLLVARESKDNMALDILNELDNYSDIQSIFPSADLEEQKATTLESFYYSLACEAFASRHLASILASSPVVDNAELKTLLYLTLLLGDETTNPLLNPAAFNSDLGRLVQGVFSCFGIRLMKSSEMPSGSLVCDQTSLRNSVSLYYNKDHAVLALYSADFVDELLDIDEAVFLVTATDLFDYVVNHFKHFSMLSSIIKNMQLPLPSDDDNLACISMQIRDALLSSEKNGRSQRVLSSPGYFPYFHEIDSELFKQVFLTDFINSFASENFIDGAQKIAPAITLKIQESDLSNSQKTFLYWLIQLDLGIEKGVNTANPLHPGASLGMGPVAVIFASFIDLIDAHHLSCFLDIKTTGKISLSTIARACNKVLEFGVRDDIPNYVSRNLGSPYVKLLEFVGRKISEKLSTYEVIIVNRRILLKHKCSFITLAAYQKSLSTEKYISEILEEEQEHIREECLKYWIESINLNRYDEALNEARNAFIMQEGANASVPINTDMGAVIEEIEKIPESKMCRAKKMLLYIIMAEDYKSNKRVKGVYQTVNFFKGDWSRPDQEAYVDSTAIIHLLNLDEDVLLLLQKNIKTRKKDMQLYPKWKGKKNYISKMCKTNFKTFFEAHEPNKLLEKIASYFKDKVKDPRVYRGGD